MNIREDLSSDEYLVSHDVGPNEAGIRLDAFLKTRYRRRSREALKRAIDAGSIIINRLQGPHLTVGRLKPSSQLVHGDEVVVVSEKKPEPAVNFNYTVLYEDQWLYAIDKPANLPVHPAGRYFFNTLLVHLKTKGHSAALKAEREYYLVHRIDKETSGVLLLAKDRTVCRNLVDQFSARTTEKKYLAIVHGIAPDTFKVTKALKRDPKSSIGLKMCVADDGQSAETSFTKVSSTERFSLLECFPKTGRQHQIRVHLESVGYPIVGDKLYGRPEFEALRIIERTWLTPEMEEKLLLPRHALHAASLKFTHPITGERMEFSSDLPQDLSSFLQKS